ncbi:hypothetical protein ACKGJN_06315 [Gillisia sp. Q332]|uniref:hypothetical protein n=1 Tax=Gillisia xinjiangensis TaxID=3384765 RepID=UPI00391BEFE5
MKYEIGKKERIKSQETKLVIHPSYVLEYCGLFYKPQLRFTGFASFLFNHKAHQEKKTQSTQSKKVIIESEPTG